jgi:hypothetical protein
MAMETKIVDEVDPGKVEGTIEYWGYFGWELMERPQRNYSKTRKRDSDGKWYIEEIEFFTITLQRDKSMPNYDELCKLEQEHNNLSEESSEGCFGCLFQWIGIFSILFSFILGIGVCNRIFTGGYGG